VLKRLERWLSLGCGLLAAAALFSIMWLTLVDVTGRKFFDHSVPGGLEMTEILMVIVIFGALPLVSWRSEHVVFDSLDNFIPERLKRVQARTVHGVCFGLFALMAWLLTRRAERFAEYTEVTVHLQLPMAPVAWVMAVLLALTALVHLAFVFRPPMPQLHLTPAAPAAPPVGAGASQAPRRTP
jgi:TRAP-type C4-dicarboxylate transport system permease small subunit